MKTVLGCIRRADADFALIEDGDRIVVGVSGGKDSLLLLYAMSLYRKFSKKQFDLRAITLDMGLRPFDLSGIAALCEQLQVPYDVVQTHIAHIIFDVRKESNPCALCAKMRRGALYDAAIRLGCNNVALGHHRDDVIETPTPICRARASRPSVRWSICPKSMRFTSPSPCSCRS